MKTINVTHEDRKVIALAMVRISHWLMSLPEKQRREITLGLLLALKDEEAVSVIRRRVGG
jgi:hypothetical protein